MTDRLLFAIDEIAGEIDKAVHKNLYNAAIVLYSSIFIIGAYMLGGL